jgi:hypothetical protein
MFNTGLFYQILTSSYKLKMIGIIGYLAIIYAKTLLLLILSYHDFHNMALINVKNERGRLSDVI